MFEAVIIDAVRTPMGKRNGSLKSWHPSELLAHVLKELVNRNNIDPAIVEDVIVGCVRQEGEQGGNIGKVAAITAEFPDSVPGVTIDRACGSGLQALQFAAHGIMTGTYKVVIAGGVESMTRIPITHQSTLGNPYSERIQKKYELGPMMFSQYAGAELIANEINLTREAIDKYSVESHRRANEARKNGYFKNEIIPVPTENGILTDDETIRENANYESVSNLKPAFEGLQTVTAGNSSQIADGASAVLIMERQFAESLGLVPRAKFKGFSVVGTDPVKMLKGPITATEKILQTTNLKLEDIDLVEINEAFAHVVLRWNHEINMPLDKVNVNGGAIALGHALGSTGTRLVATLLNELERREKTYGLITLCEGPGMGNAMIIERVGN